MKTFSILESPLRLDGCRRISATHAATGQEDNMDRIVPVLYNRVGIPYHSFTGTTRVYTESAVPHQGRDLFDDLPAATRYYYIV